MITVHFQSAQRLHPEEARQQLQTQLSAVLRAQVGRANTEARRELLHRELQQVCDQAGYQMVSATMFSETAPNQVWVRVQSYDGTARLFGFYL